MSRKARAIYDVDDEVIKDNTRKRGGAKEEMDARFIFAQRLNDILRDKEITQDQLCKDTSIGASSISAYRNGLTDPTIINLRKMANRIGVSCDYLLGLSEVKSPNPKINEIEAYTGLSEDAIAIFHKLRNAHPQFSYRIHVMNAVISADGLDELLDCLYTALQKEHELASKAKKLSEAEMRQIATENIRTGDDIFIQGVRHIYKDKNEDELVSFLIKEMGAMREKAKIRMEDEADLLRYKVSRRLDYIISQIPESFFKLTFV
jgi:transcriptional regulator with XRE-family HTH domain